MVLISTQGRPGNCDANHPIKIGMKKRLGNLLTFSVPITINIIEIESSAPLVGRLPAVLLISS